jgi:hypothetical protein
VDAPIVGEFWMKSGSHDSSLPHGYGICPFGGDDFDLGTDAFDLGSADKHHFQRRVSDFVIEPVQQLAFANGAVELASIGVAADANVDGAQA